MPNAASRAAAHWKPIDAALRHPRIRCELCPRKCVLKDGQRGFCYIRQNVDGAMQLNSYGRSSGFAIDPVEKKPLNHFLPSSNILSFGTAGCNLGCKFCQNWSISKASNDDRLQSVVAPEAIARAAVDVGCESVAFTYNDPVIFFEYALDTAAACRKLGVLPVAVTAGYITDAARAEFFDSFAATNIDLKGFSEEFYRENCNAHLQPVLDSLAYVAKRGLTWLEVTTLVIPGKNDSIVEMEAQAKWLVEHCGAFVPLHLTAFHPDFKMMNTPPTKLATLLELRDVARHAGLHFVYCGNVHDTESSTTFCHQCQTPLVVRDWFDILEYRVTSDGRCPKCATVVPGRFTGSGVPNATTRTNLINRRPVRVDMRKYNQLQL